MIDELVALATDGRERFDRDGRRAARGRILEPVLRRWMAHPFIWRKPPKTTGREEFGRNFVASQLPALRAASRNPDDWIATATAFTARSIAHAYRRWLRPLPQAGGANRRGAAGGELILCGGGARNATLADLLASELPAFRVRTIDELGIPAEAKEGLSFAMLAAACVDRVPGNLAQVTDAARPAVLGRIVAPDGSTAVQTSASQKLAARDGRRRAFTRISGRR
jgi:anhydro-N-acetylmuramic acid kinase